MKSKKDETHSIQSTALNWKKKKKNGDNEAVAITSTTMRQKAKSLRTAQPTKTMVQRGEFQSPDPPFQNHGDYPPKESYQYKG